MAKKKRKRKTAEGVIRNPNGNPKIAEYGKATQWPAGISQNPGGRPKTAVMSEALREVAELPVKKLRTLKTDNVAKASAKAMARRAVKGQVGAFSEMANRIEGKPRMAVEDLHREPVTVNVQYEDPTKDPNFVESIRQIYGISTPCDSPATPAKPPELADVLMQVAQQTDEEDIETLQKVAELAVLLQGKKRGNTDAQNSQTNPS